MKKEVVIIRTHDGEPIAKPEYLSQDYVHILSSLEDIESVIQNDHEGYADSLLIRFFELKYYLNALEQALNGRFNCIVLTHVYLDEKIQVEIE